MATKEKTKLDTRLPLSRRVLIGLALVGLVSIALIIVLQVRASTSSNTTQVSQNTVGAAVITLPTYDGQTVSLPGKPGQITVLYTMGYWCGTCVPGATALAKLQPEYAQRGVRFIAVDVSPKVKAADLDIFVEAVGDNHLTWALDGSGRFTYLYKIDSLDTAIILDGQGREVYRDHQSASDTAIRAALDKLLG